MKVYWKVDPNAMVGGAAGFEPMEFDGCSRPKESDNGKGTIILNRPTLVIYSIIDALNNDPLMDKIIGKVTIRTVIDTANSAEVTYAKAGISILRTSEEQHEAAAAEDNCHPCAR